MIETWFQNIVEHLEEEIRRWISQLDPYEWEQVIYNSVDWFH